MLSALFLSCFAALNIWRPIHRSATSADRPSPAESGARDSSLRSEWQSRGWRTPSSWASPHCHASLALSISRPNERGIHTIIGCDPSHCALW